jgi:hypothetical protein
MDSAESFLRERCVGVAWELATARLMGCVSLFLMGRWTDLAQKLPMLLSDATKRGDLYESTDLRIRIAHVLRLMADEPETALREVQAASGLWPHDQFYIAHWWSFIAEIEIALYAGQDAWRIITERWPLLRRSHLMRVQYIRIESYFHRASAALDRAARQRHSGRRLLRGAVLDARKIEREGTWGSGLACLIRAGVAFARDDTPAAKRHLESAEALLGHAGMTAYRMAARYRRGQLTEDLEGRRLMDEAVGWFQSQQVASPDRFASSLAPGFAGLAAGSGYAAGAAG